MAPRATSISAPDDAEPPPARPGTLSAAGPTPGSSKVGAAAWALAPLLWLPQAALLAWAVQRLAQGGGLAEMSGPALGLVALGALRAALEAWAGRRLFAQARAQVSALRARAVAALAGQSPLHRGRAASGQAASVLAEQAEAVLPWLTRYQPARWRVVLVPPLVALAVASQSWAAALILLLAAPVIPLAMAVVGWRAQAASQAQLQALGGMNGFLLDRLRGLSSLRALGAVDLTAQRLRASAEALRQGSMRVLRIAFLSSAALELFSALGVALVAVYVGFHLLGDLPGGSWGRQLSLGQGFFVLLLAPAFFEPLRELSAAWHDKAAGQAALQALARLGQGGPALPGALDEPAGPGDPPSKRGATHTGAGLSVQVRGLRFGHSDAPGAPPLFDGFDLDIAPGEHVALLGASGSGKSTLLALLAGLVPADAGTLRLGGQLLAPDNAAALRTRMAWIGQRPHVFHGTVGQNVALQRPGVDDAAVAAALHGAGLAHIGHAAPGERLGEAGIGLSGGELLRLALARAAVAPRADLVLADEPTAHLDRETAARVAQALLQQARGRTLVVATHDLALASRIGRVVRLDQRPDPLLDQGLQTSRAHGLLRSAA